VDGAGNVYLTGEFAGTTNFFGTNLTGTGNAFVMKLNTDGAFQWVTSTGGTGADAGNGVAVDGYGDIFVTGYIDGTATFDPTHGLTTSTETAFLWKLTQS
jgi:hypothetical protein